MSDLLQPLCPKCGQTAKRHPYSRPPMRAITCFSFQYSVAAMAVLKGVLEQDDAGAYTDSWMGTSRGLQDAMAQGLLVTAPRRGRRGYATTDAGDQLYVKKLAKLPRAPWHTWGLDT